jgi:hypothetical protein
MSAALSPTSTSVNSDGPVTKQDFGELIKYFQQTHKALIRMTALVNRLPATQSLSVGAHRIKRQDVNRASQAFISQLGDLRKVFASRKKRSGKNNNQLKSLFYVSDQLVDFYKKSDLGKVDPSDPDSEDLTDEIELITKNKMSTGGILTSLIFRYIEHNNLRENSSKGRFLPDSNMEKQFSNTKYMLDGKDISKRKIRLDAAPDKVEKIKTNIADNKNSAFKRVSSRKDKKTGKSFYEKDTGLLNTAMMIFNNFYRIPKELLTDEERERLVDPDAIEMAEELQKKLSKITETVNARKKRI